MEEDKNIKDNYDTYICPIMSKGNEIVKCKLNKCMAWGTYPLKKGYTIMFYNYCHLCKNIEAIKLIYEEHGEDMIPEPKFEIYEKGDE
jgi:hypothetical protein